MIAPAGALYLTEENVRSNLAAICPIPLTRRVEDLALGNNANKVDRAVHKVQLHTNSIFTIVNNPL